MRAAAAILHADLDAFYASVEQLLEPRFRGKPLAVGGGVVLAASYEARAFGVRGGMPARQARALCPNLIFTPGRFAEYQRLGDAAIAILRDYTPDVERTSIDEAFADVTGCEALFGPPPEIAKTIRARVRRELGLPISIGVASTKRLAKIASQCAKPDGLIVIEPGSEREFLEPLPVGLLWGVGPVARARLATEGIATIGQFLARAPERVEALLGDDRRPRVEPRRRARSASAQAALGRSPACLEACRPVLLRLAERIAARLRNSGRSGRTVSVRVRFGDYRSILRARTLRAPTAGSLAIAEAATALVAEALAARPDQTTVTLLGIAIAQFGAEPLQLDLPLGLPDERHRPGAVAGRRRARIDHALDDVRARFGTGAIGYASVQGRGRALTPDGFRRLAERPL